MLTTYKSTFFFADNRKRKKKIDVSLQNLTERKFYFLHRFFTLTSVLPTLHKLNILQSNKLFNLE